MVSKCKMYGFWGAGILSFAMSILLMFYSALMKNFTISYIGMIIFFLVIGSYSLFKFNSVSEQIENEKLKGVVTNDNEF